MLYYLVGAVIWCLFGFVLFCLVYRYYDWLLKKLDIYNGRTCTINDWWSITLAWPAVGLMILVDLIRLLMKYFWYPILSPSELISKYLKQKEV